LTESSPGTGQAVACRRCGECCRRYQVRLDLAEAGRIAGRLGLPVAEFRDRYADRRWPGQSSLLLRQENGACPFLERPAGNGDELCAIHDFKPASCREWAAGPDRPECRAGLARRPGFIDLLARDRRP